METRRVRLSDAHVRDRNWGGGFKATLECAAHEWYDWAFPDHDEDMCDEFNLGAHIISGPDGRQRIRVFDLLEQM